MLQIPQNTGMSESMGSIADSVPKISNMLISADKCMVVPDKIIISISEPITIKSPKVVTDDAPLKATKSESAENIKDKENDKKLSDAAKRRHKMMGGWFKDIGKSLKKSLTDNPIVNFIKDHWGKIMIGAMMLFLKPEQWKTIWKGIKSLAHWAITDGVTILKGIFEVLDEYVPKLFDVFVEVVKFFGTLIDNVFGKRDKDADGNEIGNRKGGLFGEGETGPLGIIKGVLSGLALLTTGIGALGLLIAPGSTLLLGFTALKGLLKAPFNLIPKLPGISGAGRAGPTIANAAKLPPISGAGRVGPTIANAANLGTSTTAKLGTSFLQTTGKGLMAPGPIAAMVATALAAAAVGMALNKYLIGPMMKKHYKNVDKKVAKERKEEINNVDKVYGITKAAGAGSGGGVGNKGSLANRISESMKGDKNIKRRSGIWGTESDRDFARRGGGEGLSIEEVKKKYAKELAAAAKKRGAVDLGKKEMGLSEYSGSEEYKQTREGAGTKDFIADTTGERKEKYTAAMTKIRTDNVDPEKKEVEELVFKTRRLAKGVKSKTKLGRIWRKFGKELVTYSPMWKDRALRVLTRKELKLVGRDGRGTKSKGLAQAKELMREIRGVDKTKRTREQVSADKKQMADIDRRGAGDAMFEEPIVTPAVPRVSPQDKTTALKQSTDKMLDGKSGQQSASVNVGGATHNKTVTTSTQSTIIAQNPASATQDKFWNE